MAIFKQTFVVTAKTHKVGSVLVSFAAQTILVVVGILIPMIYFDALPTAQLWSLLLAPPPPPPTPPPPPPEAPRVVKFIPRPFDADKLVAAQVIPKISP
jgi:protein TonB